MDAVTATDNCDPNVTVTYSQVTTPGTCENQYTITRTWIAIDNCDNANTQIQTITVRDTKPPVLVGVPGDVTADCGANNVPPVATVTATDNCDLNVSVIFTETKIDGACPDSYTLTRLWTATDNCGNSSTGKQTISVGDVTPPVFTNKPADVTVQCDAVPRTGTVTATDDYDANVTVTYNEVKTPGTCKDSYVLTRTWVAIDNCANANTHSQKIT
ncbi:MAG: hypothetical protein IPJ06_05365 [Saprospiraceae bacterium]|nr:hypothetical protein [Saprospiraceae bacterium]